MNMCTWHKLPFPSYVNVFQFNILKFDIRSYSAFKLGCRNRRPNDENLRFWPKILTSGILEEVCNSSWKFHNNCYHICRIAKCICKIRELLSPFSHCELSLLWFSKTNYKARGLNGLPSQFNFAKMTLSLPCMFPTKNTINSK